ncbi:MBL fold metallo-hydrolase [Marinicella sp. S1101]|uniref:MBL fold metallo-hydrolase n=1 Tax=Marinicella marina TaxID=2996016 RepID=UPI002260C8F1|nr:MBL fold metallo-hydrolase [Marinicella marina]MCX7552602.1 MBL fold metallo-hydrolase [Marinicella marina]
MKKLLLAFTSAFVLAMASGASAHKHAEAAITHDSGQVTYLGNTGLLASHGEIQVLFDPFFHNHYGQYQLVPKTFRQAMFNAEAPFDAVKMVLISHAHGDHFDASDVVKYMQMHDDVMLVAPTQAVEQMQLIAGFGVIQNRIKSIDLAYGDAPISHFFDGIEVNAVRIPHAGWPGRADVSNLVYRVTINNQATVMHMGDADPDDVHFKPWQSYWQSKRTDRAYPPYWFMLTPSGQDILTNRINATSATGVHVPVNVPTALKNSGARYFSKTGSSHAITNNQESEKP